MVNRHFAASGSDRVWVADIIQHRTWAGCLAVVVGELSTAPSASTATAEPHAFNPTFTDSPRRISWPAQDEPPLAVVRAQTIWKHAGAMLGGGGS